MNTKMIIVSALALLAVPLAFAHVPAGTPKNYCEDPSEFNVHDYGPPATGTSVFLLQDGNLAGDCNGDTVPADFDNHLEFAFGGGWILADSGDGVTGGAVACYGVPSADHNQFGPVRVQDNVFGRTVPFRVESDTVNLVPPTDPTAPECGDFTTDVSTVCVDFCTVTFPAGLDGAYIVYVGDVFAGAAGTAGHICWGPENTPDACPDDATEILSLAFLQCINLVDDPDADTGRDWIDIIGTIGGSPNPDPECNEGVAGTGILDPDGEN